MSHERRTDEEIRAMIERVADRAAEKAVRRFSELTPWDMTTKEGREQARATISHANTLRVACDAMKSDGSRLVRNGILWGLALSLLFGVSWLLGIDPARILKAMGGGR